MDVEGAKEAAIASRVEPDNPTPQASKTVREKIGATDTHLLEEDRSTALGKVSPKTPGTTLLNGGLQSLGQSQPAMGVS